LDGSAKICGNRILGSRRKSDDDGGDSGKKRDSMDEPLNRKKTRNLRASLPQ